MAKTKGNAPQEQAGRGTKLTYKPDDPSRKPIDTREYGFLAKLDELTGSNNARPSQPSGPDWTDLVNELRAFGWTRKEIDNMTLREFKAHLVSVAKKELEREARYISSTAIATQSTGDNIKSVVGDLKRNANSIKN